MFQKPDYVKIIKIASGASMAIALAEGLGLNYSASAGVVTLLTIQDTKRETIRVTVRRLYSFGLSLIVSAVCFLVFGYSVAAVGAFLLVFSTICILFRMQEGISVNTVLMTHFLAERTMAVPAVGNELALLLIGAGTGVILNLYIPGKRKQIKERQNQIEELMKEILVCMAWPLSAYVDEDAGRLTGCLAELDEVLERGERNAYEEMENKLLSETKYYIRYMSMRKMQSTVLSGIAESVNHLKQLPPQAEQIAGLMREISSRLHEYNNAVELLEALEQVKQSMRAQPLPAGREEFESRAVLFRILLDLERFLMMKKDFVEELTEEEIRTFWEGEDMTVGD